MTNTTTAQSAISALTTLSTASIVRADLLHPEMVATVDLLIDLGLAGEFDNGPDAVRVFHATDAGRAALVRVHAAQRAAMNEILSDAVAVA